MTLIIAVGIRFHFLEGGNLVRGLLWRLHVVTSGKVTSGLVMVTG